MARLLVASEAQHAVDALEAAGEHTWAQALTDELNEGQDPYTVRFLLGALLIMTDVIRERLGDLKGKRQ